MNARLDVGKVVFGALMLPWWHRRAFGRALAIPLLLLATLALSQHYAYEYLREPSQWMLAVLYGVFLTIFAVTCHRLVLLDAAAAGSRLIPRWSSRETRFLLWLVAVGLIFALVFALTTFVLIFILRLLFSAGAPMGANTVDAWPDWLWFFASTPALFLSARICLVFPATAVGRKVDLQWAWNLSASNGWRLVLVVDLLPWLIAQILGVLSRRNASMYETVILTLIGLIFSAVEVAALSLSYRELTKEEGDSTSSTISGAGAD